MSNLIASLLCIAFLIQLASCQKATCVLTGTENDANITGTITFTPSNDEVLVEVEVSGITVNTNALHGIHIHQYGDISDQAGAQAVGGHWNPEGSDHGCPNATDRHYGDMGNWNVSEAGEISMSKTLNLIALTGNNSVVGHAVVVHGDTDDCTTVASSGPRLAQCVIGIANEADNTAASGLTGVTKAVADLWPTDGNTPYGRVVFSQANDDAPVTVKAAIWNMTGIHGFHIHEFGDISAAAGTATGGHYNPEGVDHAIPPNTPRHVGDMGNIYYYEDVIAYYEFENDMLTLNGMNNIIGRGVIIHADPDNCDQPTGAAGARVAQGVIGIANPTTTDPDGFPADVPTDQDTDDCVESSTTATNTEEDNSATSVVLSFGLVLAAVVAILF